MASSTRSGRVLRHEGTSSTRGGNATVKGKNIKDSPTSSSKATGTKNRESNGTAKDTRSSTTSAYVTADSSSLKNSSSETSDKKMTASTPTSRKSERVEKKRSRSPLRRSERIEKNAISSSPGSKKLKESSSSLLKKKKLNDDKNGKIAVKSTENWSEDNKLDTKNSGISKKKMRLDARRYRALLQPKNDEFSDDNDMVIKDSPLKGNSANSTSGSSKKVNEGLDERNGRKEDIICGKYSVDDHKEGADVSTSCSRELVDLMTGSDKLRKSARLSGKEKIEDKALVLKCSDGNPQSSTTGLTTNNSGVVENKRDSHKLDVEELEASGFVATSEGKSLASDRSPGCGVNFEGSKNTKLAASLDLYVSVTAGNIDICNPETSKADVTSPPCETTSRDTKRCTFCNELERVHNVSEAHGSCLCNSQKDHVLAPSVIEGPCELLSNSCESEAPSTHSHVNSDEGNLALEDREHSSGSEKKNGLVTSPIKKNVTVPLNVDRGTFGVSNGMHTFEEHLRVGHLSESPVAAQTDSSMNACVICKHPGQLLCCGGKGCKQGYHLSCLCPPLQDIPPGVWLCHFCVRKKVEPGVLYSVSDGIESIWDVKEGIQNGKQYFVKYKGLAHVHNRWVPESQILTEAPMLAAKFDRIHQKEKATRWKQEWTQPHRLLQRRQLIPKGPADDSFLEHGNKFSYCYHEWLVKWKGLGYEHATWELESAPFLCSSDARVLIHDFESRQEEAKRRSDPSRTDKARQVKTSSFHKLTKLPNDCPAGFDNDHLNSVNRLREFWHKSQNAVFIDDQERIIKSILFLLSLKSHTSQPILVISTIHCLSLWETEFIRLAPSINLVVYTGTKDIRELIRSSEFYEEGGCVMFQVLLSHPDAIIEDFDAVDCIGWEALIIDECRNPRVSKHLEQFKNLSTEFRLILLSGQLKDNVAEYINLLSFLESISLKYTINDTAVARAILKKKLIRYLAYERKPGSSMFVEYWVPVGLSNVQLEQYCSALVSNVTTLRSCSKIDHVGALRDILISTRKCCDHPYLVGGSLQNSLIKDLPWEKYLDIGVEASGKLYLLDKFLHEIKNQGFRVLILFQSIGGAGRNSIGDILDDFVRQRFGPDSYERVDGGLIMSKKIAALSKFNDKANGRFIFLIENRACLPSIKLSSVDAAVIFNSDWNPLNDLTALQKIHIESQFEHVKVYRLYSSCTVEEKVLIFAKQDMILGTNIQNISPSNSHLLLSWGALHLFNELDGFHWHNTHDSSENSSENCFLNDSMLKFLNDVMDELVKVLPGKAENDGCQCSLLIKAQHSGASYSRNITLVGERNGISALDKDPSSFWSDLLDKRYPNWKFISESSQRIRKKVQHFKESLKVSGVENDELRKKRRKLTSNTIDPISLQTWLQDKTKGMIRDAKVLDDISLCSVSEPASVFPTTAPTFPSSMPIEPETYGSQTNLQASSISDDAAELHKSPTSESEGRRNAQRVLHLCLKPEISELCDTLKLPDDVKHKAHDLLEHLMNNHHVNREPETILQAFKLSVCLRAAKFMKHMVDHKECLALAKKYLNYTCTEEQANSVYSKLRILKKIFSLSGSLRREGKPNSLENESSLSRKVYGAQKMHGGASESALSNLQKSEVKEASDGHSSSRLLLDLDHEQAPGRQSPSKVQQKLGSLKDALLEKRIDLVGIICSKREDALALKQQEELSDFNVHREEEKMRLKSAHNDLLELIRFIHTDYTIRNDKIKLLNQDFSKKMAEFDQHMKCQRTKLTVMQEDAMNKEREIRKRWLEEASADTLAEAFETLPLTESGFRLEEFKELTGQVEACDGSRSTMSGPASDRVCRDTVTTFPGVYAGITENGLYIPSTLFHGRLEDGQTLAFRSSNIAEMESLQPIGTFAEILETVPPNMLEVESIELDGKSFKISRPASDLMFNDMITTIPPMSSGTTENHLDMTSTFSIAMVEDAQNLASHSSVVAEVEAIQPNGTSAEIPETALQNMAEVKSIEPNEASPEIPATSLPAGDGDISKDSGTSFSESLIMTGTMHMVPLEINGRTVEIPENVRPNMVVPESIQPNETSVEISAAIFPPGDGDITKDGGTLFSTRDVVNVLNNQTEPNETSTEPPTTIPLAGDGDFTGGGSPFSKSDIINALGKKPATIHMMPSVATSLPMETETPVSQSNDMVEVEYVQPNRLSAEVPASISFPEEGSFRGPQAPPQMNPTGNGPDEMLIDSTVATTEAIADRDIREGEDNGANVGSTLQNPVDLHSISHASTNNCYGNSTSSGEVLPVSEHERLAVTVGTGCDDSFACPQTTTPAVSFSDVSTSQAESTVQLTCIIDSTLLQVPPTDNLSTENGQACTPQPLISEGENHMDDAHSCQSRPLSIQQPIVTAEVQVEESNRLAPQSVLHQVLPAETLGTQGLVRPESICSASQTGVPVQQSIVPAALQAEQSNHLLSRSVHPLLPSANLLPESTHSEVIADTGFPQQPGGRLLQMLPMAACVHPHGLHPDPLQNELTRIQKQVELCTKLHEDKKLQLNLKCEEEIEKVRKKYASLLQDDEAGFQQDKKILETIYNKVFVNRILAEEFRTKFIDTKAGASASSQGRSSSSLQQSLQASHTSNARWQSSIPGSVHAPSFTNLPPVATPARSSAPLNALAGSGAQVLANPSATSGLVVRNTISVIPNNHVRSQFGHTLAPRSNLQGGPDVRASASRAPAPHLHRFRPQSSSMPAILPPRPSQLSSEQHLRSNLGTATAASTIPPVHLPRPPYNGTYLPVASGQLPLSQGISPPSVELPRDLGATNVTDLPQLVVGPSVHGRVPLKSPVSGSEMATSTVVTTKPADSAAPVVCLSDDE